MPIMPIVNPNNKAITSPPSNADTPPQTNNNKNDKTLYNCTVSIFIYVYSKIIKAGLKFEIISTHNSITLKIRKKNFNSQQITNKNLNSK